MVENGIILSKYWLEVSPDQQTRRLEGRINDPRPARIIGIITRIDRPLSPAAAAYVDLLFAAVGRPAYNKHKRQPLPAA